MIYKTYKYTDQLKSWYFCSQHDITPAEPIYRISGYTIHCLQIKLRSGMFVLNEFRRIHA